MVASLVPIPIGEPISQLYSLSLRVVGLAAFVMFLLAGLAYIIPENIRPGFLKDPMTIIKDTIIGVIILFSAYVILNSINPDLVRSSPTTSTSGNTFQPGGGSFGGGGASGTW